MKTRSKQSGTKKPAIAKEGSPSWLEQWRRTEKPVVLKINDTHVYRLEDPGSIERLAHLIARLDTVNAIREGIEEVNRGETVSLEEFEAQARSQHGLPD
jgi:hypothetical protein